LSPDDARSKLGAFARHLLAIAPTDSDLIDTFARLRVRDFLPPAPLTLPRGDLRSVDRALSQRTASELSDLAESMVTLPDPGLDRATAEAALALFLRVPSARDRARRMLEALESSGLPTGLARLRLALSEAPDTAPSLLARLSPEDRPEGLARVALHLLPERTEPGLEWLVRVDESFIGNVGLAFARRPALEDELGPLGEMLRELAQTGPFRDADAADFAGQHDLATSLYASIGSDDRARILDARGRALQLPHTPHVELPRPELPSTGLIARLSTLTSAFAPAEPGLALDGALLERLSDSHGAAALFHRAALSGDLESLTHAVRLRAHLTNADRQTLVRELERDPRITDEVELVKSPELRRRLELLSVLAPERVPLLGLVRLAAATPRTPPQPGSARRSLDDPHHPENRLAAASDLLASGKDEPAANILSALLRKVDLSTPPRLYAVVAQALEADAPPAELLTAVHRTLSDPQRARPLLEALGASPSGAFAVHEELRDLATSPSQPDELRLFALETWLGIWRATETAPDPDAIRSLREAEPSLLVAAATSLSGLPSPLNVIRRFLERHPPLATTPEDFSEALLALMLGRPT
jgi:hypothetical protein